MQSLTPCVQSALSSLEVKFGLTASWVCTRRVIRCVCCTLLSTITWFLGYAKECALEQRIMCFVRVDVIFAHLRRAVLSIFMLWTGLFCQCVWQGTTTTDRSVPSSDFVSGPILCRTRIVPRLTTGLMGGALPLPSPYLGVVKHPSSWLVKYATRSIPSSSAQ